jgi:pimeloyl-ACP methyl ester carboxylesterase
MWKFGTRFAPYLTMAFADCEDETIFYEMDLTKSGEKVILLIHGLGSNNKIWNFLSESLYRKYNFIKIDLPGHGKSTAANRYFSIKRCAQIIERFLEKIGCSNVYVGGLSMGGAIALQLALDFPEKVKGAVLISGWSFCDEDFKIRLQSYINILKTNGIQELIDHLILPRHFTKDFALLNPQILHEYKKIKIEQSEETYISSSRACMEFDVREKLIGIKIPLLLIAGEHDVLTPPYHSKIILENTKNSKLSILPNCGHVPFIEKPYEFAFHVADFLSTVEGF